MDKLVDSNEKNIHTRERVWKWGKGRSTIFGSPLITVHHINVRKTAEVDNSNGCESYLCLPRSKFSCMENKFPLCSGNRNAATAVAEKVASTAKSVAEAVL